MVENSSIPKFGDQLESETYQPRPGAYGVLVGPSGRLAIVRTPKGDHLPGGGSLRGESPERTLRREALEEAGLRPGELSVIGEAWEYVYAAEEGMYYCKQGVFFYGPANELAEAGQESDHELVWLSLDEALASLVHGSQRWAVNRYRTEKGV